MYMYMNLALQIIRAVNCLNQYVHVHDTCMLYVYMYMYVLYIHKDIVGVNLSEW